jgi:hypothetical protein
VDIEQRRLKLEDWRWNKEKEGIAGTGLCPLSNGSAHRIALSASGTSCLGSPRCDPKLLAEFFASEVVQSGKTAALEVANAGSTPALGTNGHAKHNDLFQWKYKLSFIAKHTLTDPKLSRYVENESRENLHAGLINTLREACEKIDTTPPPGMNPIEVEEDLDALARDCLNQYAPEQLPARTDEYLPAEPASGEIVVIDWEDHASALIANQEYLTHTPIIEGLCYAKTASLLVGGKHSGKTTNARTIALSVCRGLPVFGRNVLQGPVLYCASEDEVLVVRAELLRMGWNPADPLNLMKIGSKTLADPERLLDAISMFATSKRAVLIILDMLFDFAGIRDEMSYAGTREAAGKVYDLAMRTGAHVIATHHSPKYMSGGATAETAALGSQGIAARFSPIILSRHWGADLYTIESTPPRDPRGKAIEAVCVLLDDNGMSHAGEKFADSMRWRVMAPKVLDFISSVDPGQHHTVSALAEGMEINRPMMQTILYNLCKEGKLHREKKGRSYKYFLPQAQENIWNNQE